MRTGAVLRHVRTRVITVVSLALLPGFLLVFVTTGELQQERREEVRAEALRLVRHSARTEAALVGATGALLEELARTGTTALESGTSTACSVVGSVPYARPGVVAPDGRVICTAQDQRDGRDVSRERWFREAVATRSFTLAQDRRTAPGGGSAVVAALPVVGADGSLEVVVFARVPLNSLAEWSTGRQLPDRTALAVVDERGRIVARHPTSDRTVGRSLPGADRALGTRRSVTYEAVGRDGDRRIFAVAPRPVGPGYLSVSMPTELADADAARVRRQGLLAMALASAAVLALAVVVTRRSLLRPLRRVVEAARGLAVLDLFGWRRQLVPSDDLGLDNTLGSIADVLEAHRHEDERRLRQLVMVEQGERARIADTLHDDSLQVLAAVSIQVQLLERRLDLSDEEAAVLASLRQPLAEAAVRLRQALYDLRPPGLDHGGLAVALGAFLGRAFPRGSAAWELRHRVSGEIPADVEAVLFRIAQDALANVQQHAGAGRVTVDVEGTDTGVVLEVRDDGRGFDPDAAPARRGEVPGLAAMWLRVLAVGGSLEVTSQPGGGTTVRVWAPLGEERDRPAAVAASAAVDRPDRP